MTQTSTTQTLTTKQAGFIRSLLETRTGYTDGFKQRVTDAVDAGTMPKAKASEVIDWLMAKDEVAKPKGKAKLPDVREGYFAVPSVTGGNDLDFFRVDRPTKGRYAGMTFAKRVIGGRPDAKIPFPQLRGVLERIVAAGVDDAMARYGKEIGRCGKCNHRLTDEISRELGIGPVCRGMIGFDDKAERVADRKVEHLLDQDDAVEAGDDMLLQEMIDHDAGVNLFTAKVREDWDEEEF